MGGMEPPLILIVEDEKDIARFIELELQAEGYRTEVAHDGITGLSKFREVSPNLVILDLMLPVMDGIEVAKRIRKTSNVPILILTAKGEEEDRVLGLELGADDYVVKPFSVKELLARVQAVIRRSPERPLDVTLVNFPGGAADLQRRELRRAGAGEQLGDGAHWKKHFVFERIRGESPSGLPMAPAPTVAMPITVTVTSI